MAVVSLILSFYDRSTRKIQEVDHPSAILFFVFSRSARMFLVGTNQTTPGRSVSNHDDKGSHFVWRYHELINCDNSAETPVKKAEGPELHFLLVTRLI